MKIHFFRVFDVESSSNCIYDKVRIYNGPTTNHMLLGKHCGVFRPGDTMGTSNRMLMTFETDGNNVHPKSGFYAVFVSVPQRLAGKHLWITNNYTRGIYIKPPRADWHDTSLTPGYFPLILTTQILNE